MRHYLCALAIFLCALVVFNAYAQETKLPPSDDRDANQHLHCLILVGLPGDAIHQVRFKKLTSSLHKQLLSRGFPKQNIRVLLDKPPKATTEVGQISKDAIASLTQELTKRLTTDDSFWLFVIGHADHDGEHVRFHLPGPDLRGVDYADFFSELRCKEQVFWITSSSSGWFTEPLSAENRIVVTATARDAEPNETEFPEAFIEAMAAPVQDLDRNQDGDVSVLELFAQTHALVEDSYALDERAPTEHATIDDNGDGRGSEWKEILAELERIKLVNQSQSDQTEPPAEAANLKFNSKLDGRFAAKTKIPVKNPPQRLDSAN